ncbi:hypothetical protein EDB84DRAFT_1492405 [Lactarius hengduanensis]|nr:hypothetical protein EDB84DRAFT_1492405 [Lactarius hengduanensis]
MAVASSPATRKSFVPPNGRISSGHCSPSVPSCPGDGTVVSMSRSSTRDRKGEIWPQIWVMEDICHSNCSHEIRNSTRVEVPGWVRQMEITCPKIRMFARVFDLWISIRSMNRPSCKVSMVGWLKNVISMSPRPGASILATRLSRYLLVPRYLKLVRAGRTTRSHDGGGKLMWLRRGGRERKWSVSCLSWVMPDKAFANASGEK